MDIVFLCHHDIAVGAPVVLPSAGDWCHYSWEWSTSLACPPHDVRSCTIDAPDGEVDLSVLSRPDTNYQVPGEDAEGGKFVLNVCRSIINTGFTFDLGLWSEKKNYKWAGSYRHIKGQFEFNICGGLVDSQCGDGAGVCSTEDPGAGNKQLTIEDGQLYLNYTEGGACEDGGRRHAQINFNCPYVRNFTASATTSPANRNIASSNRLSRSY